LIVEGRDDLYSIAELLARHGYEWENVRIVRPFIKAEGGISDVLEELPVAAKGPYERLGGCGLVPPAFRRVIRRRFGCSSEVVKSMRLLAVGSL
jgi:hypothetical protein